MQTAAPPKEFGIDESQRSIQLSRKVMFLYAEEPPAIPLPAERKPSLLISNVTGRTQILLVSEYVETRQLF